MKKFLLGAFILLIASKSYALQVGDVEVMGKVIANEVHFSTVGKVASIWFINGSSFTGGASGGSSDNLGSHKSTQTLNMAGFGISNSTGLQVGNVQFTLYMSTVDTKFASIGGGGAGSLAVATGSAQAANIVSSPAFVVNLSSGIFKVRPTGGNTAYIDVDFSSITANGDISSLLATFSVLEFRGIKVDAITGSATYFIFDSTGNLTAPWTWLGASSITVNGGATVSSLTVTGLKQQVELQLAGASWKGTVTNGAGDTNKLSESSETLNSFNYDYHRFSMNTTQYVYADFIIPKGYDGSTMTFSYIWTSTGFAPVTASGSSVTFCMQGAAVTDLTFSSNVVYGSSVCLSDVAPSSNTIMVSNISNAFTPSGTTSGAAYYTFRLFRDVAQDNLPQDAYLMNTQLFYTRRKASDE